MVAELLKAKLQYSDSKEKVDQILSSEAIAPELEQEAELEQKNEEPEVQVDLVEVIAEEESSESKIDEANNEAEADVHSAVKDKLSAIGASVKDAEESCAMAIRVQFEFGLTDVDMVKIINDMAESHETFIVLKNMRMLRNHIRINAMSEETAE